MKIFKILVLLLVLPVCAWGAGRGDVKRSGGVNAGTPNTRMSITSMVPKVDTVKKIDVEDKGNSKAGGESKQNKDGDKDQNKEADGSAACRDSYRECMDNFCLLDENQGERCACSDNINRAKDKLQEVLDIQAEADKLFSEGVESEMLGAKARLVFVKESATESKTNNDTRKAFMNWLNGSKTEGGDVGEDEDIGSNLLAMAEDYCADELKACGSKAEMEESLYERMVTQDCKNYEAYLKDQKANAESNKRMAEAAVRKARLEMLDTTNKYKDPGTCLLAYRSCVADTGGCGVNFENCLDAKLLQRRASACGHILDQCMAVRDEVLKDWEEESKMILADAQKYAESRVGVICKAKVTNCLEEVCATSTDSACLSNVDLAAEMCPVIKECDEKIEGYMDSIKDRLAEMRTKFCQNDVNKCLQDKCGIDYTAPECLGKSPREIATTMCPQKMFVSCKNETFFESILSAALMKMDYQQVNGCVNYFDSQLSKVCGTDMACLPIVSSAENFETRPSNIDDQKEKVREESKNAVDDFFKQFENDLTVDACKSLQGNLADKVFASAKQIAEISAENRNLRALDAKLAELSRKEDVAKAEKNCYDGNKVDTPDKSKSNYMYIKSVHFEPNLRNCHVCRVQQVCEEGGESKATSALKSAAGGLAGGAGAGATAGGWGALIGGVVGAAGGAALGAASGGKKKFCQEIESCEDINY